MLLNNLNANLTRFGKNINYANYLKTEGMHNIENKVKRNMRIRESDEIKFAKDCIEICNHF